jgi:hypothetical protein
MIRFIVFLFIFPVTVSARNSCSNLSVHIQKINDTQNTLLNKDNMFERLAKVSKNIEFFKKFEQLSGKDIINKEFKKIITGDKNFLLSLHSICQGWDKDKISDADCSKKINIILHKPDELNKTINLLAIKQKAFHKAIKYTKKSDEMLSLGIIKKHLAQQFLNAKCDTKTTSKSLSYEQAYNYACRDSVHRPHVKGMEDFTKDNLDILLKLNLKVNKVSKRDLRVACIESKEIKNFNTPVCAKFLKVKKKKILTEEEEEKRKIRVKKNWKSAALITSGLGAAGVGIWGMNQAFSFNSNNSFLNNSGSWFNGFYGQNLSQNSFQNYNVPNNFTYPNYSLLEDTKPLGSTPIKPTYKSPYSFD